MTTNSKASTNASDLIIGETCSPKYPACKILHDAFAFDQAGPHCPGKKAFLASKSSNGLLVDSDFSVSENESFIPAEGGENSQDEEAMPMAMLNDPELTDEAQDKERHISRLKQHIYEVERRLVALNAQKYDTTSLPRNLPTTRATHTSSMTVHVSNMKHKASATTPLD